MAAVAATGSLLGPWSRTGPLKLVHTHADARCSCAEQPSERVPVFEFGACKPMHRPTAPQSRARASCSCTVLCNSFTSCSVAGRGCGQAGIVGREIDRQLPSPRCPMDLDEVPSNEIIPQHYPWQVRGRAGGSPAPYSSRPGTPRGGWASAPGISRTATRAAPSSPQLPRPSR